MYDLRREEIERSRPLPPESPKPRGSWMPVVTVLVFLAVLVGGVAVLAGPPGLIMMGVVAAVLSLPLLHYLAWGWWLSGAIRDEERRRRDEQKP